MCAVYKHDWVDKNPHSSSTIRQIPVQSDSLSSRHRETWLHLLFASDMDQLLCIFVLKLITLELIARWDRCRCQCNFYVNGPWIFTLLIPMQSHVFLLSLFYARLCVFPRWAGFLTETGFDDSAWNRVGVIGGHWQLVIRSDHDVQGI
jgi:hypothetical protein